MIGYLYVALVLACGGIKGYCGKRTSYLTRTVSDAAMLNLLRMLLCIIIGGTIMLIGGNVTALAVSGTELLSAALNGVFSAAFVVTWLLAVKSSAYMMVDVFLLLGCVIPIILSRIFYSEQVSIPQVVGMILLVVAAYVMTGYNASIKGKLSLSSIIFLSLCGISNGAADFSQKVFVKLSTDTPISVFQLYSFMFSAATLFAVCLFLRIGKKNSGDSIGTSLSRLKGAAGYIAVMAVCLFLHSYFKTAAANHFDSVQLYPILQGGGMLVALLISALCFKERITLKCLIGVALALVAMIMLNLF